MYIDHPIKCNACGLHYTVHSWNEDWHETDGGKHVSNTNGGFCPECGVHGGKLIFAAKPNEGQIFNVVGETQLKEITAVVARGISYGAEIMKRSTERGA